MALTEQNDQIFHLFNFCSFENLFVDAVYLRFDNYIQVHDVGNSVIGYEISGYR